MNNELCHCGEMIDCEWCVFVVYSGSKDQWVLVLVQHEYDILVLPEGRKAISSLIHCNAKIIKDSGASAGRRVDTDKDDVNE